MKSLPILLLLCVAVCSAYPLDGAAREISRKLLRPQKRCETVC
uniref:Matrix metallopeptidase 3 n=1 Tax=Homo sapiens TaxID=9606 RepID=E9PKX2_HUMAN